MPFDAASSENPNTLLYTKRREGACAIWERVPRQVFDMRQWKSDCGTKACALGWLAAEEYDGWHWVKGHTGENLPVRFDGENVYKDAAKYFGLTVAEATALFGCWRPTASTYKRWSIKGVRPTDVAKRLRSMPIWQPA